MATPDHDLNKHQPVYCNRDINLTKLFEMETMILNLSKVYSAEPIQFISQGEKIKEIQHLDTQQKYRYKLITSTTDLLTIDNIQPILVISNIMSAENKRPHLEFSCKLYI